ncbi:hypothetical protein D3C77_247680 [compost metagenome]
MTYRANDTNPSRGRSDEHAPSPKCTAYRSSLSHNCLNASHRETKLLPSRPASLKPVDPACTAFRPPVSAASRCLPGSPPPLLYGAANRPTSASYSASVPRSAHPANDPWAKSATKPLAWQRTEHASHRTGDSRRRDPQRYSSLPRPAQA